jgi:hypothetical protein
LALKTGCDTKQSKKKIKSKASPSPKYVTSDEDTLFSDNYDSSDDKKVEYVRSVFLNARRPHIKSGIGYRNGEKHNSRVNTKGQEFIKFTKANVQQEKK